MATHLSISLLGDFHVTLDGNPVTRFESIKVRALLAYLAVEADRLHSRDVLAGLLWPEFPERAALSNLRYALSDLRQTIGDREARPPFLLISSDSLQFNTGSHYTLDVGQFVQGIKSEQIERLEQAVALYRGAFLNGFAIADSAAFEEWLMLKREQFGRLMLTGLRHLADYYEQCGEYEQAQRYAWQQVELEPWLEEGHQQLMRVLTLGGQRSAALAQYETCRHLLADELGVEPVPETTELYEQIRDRTLAPRPAPPAFLISQAQAADIERPRFVAREVELARLDGFLKQMMTGRGQDDVDAGIHPACAGFSAGVDCRWRQLQCQYGYWRPVSAIPGNAGHAHRGCRGEMGRRSDHAGTCASPVGAAAEYGASVGGKWPGVD